MSLNKVMLIGNSGKDPDVRHLESGVATATFTLATTERYRERNGGELREQTEWHTVVCWRNLAETVERYVRKGTQVYVEGKLRYRSYTDRDGNTRYVTEIVADSIQLLGRKADNPASSAGQYPARDAQPYGQPAYAQPQDAGTKGTVPMNLPDTGQDMEAGDDLPF